jgi:hypothetical protein
MSSKLENLPSAPPLDPTDLFLISKAGATYKAQLGAIQIAESQGNVLGYQGIDPTGATDSSQAIMDAIESPYPVYVPGGLYRIDDPLLFLLPKIFYCFGGASIRSSIITLGDPPLPDPIITYEQARFFTTNNINMFDIQCQEVHIRGGFYELKHSAPTKAVFYYPLVNNGTGSGGPSDFGGWGGSIKDVVCAGSEGHLTTLDGGGMAVHYDFAGQTVNNAYITHQDIEIEARNMRYGIFASARNPGYGQWANNCIWKVHSQAVKSAITDFGAFNNNLISSWHQGKHLFTTLAEANTYASIYLRGVSHIIETSRFYDFGKSTQNGKETNQVKYDVVGADNQFPERDEFASDYSTSGETFWPRIRNPVGFIPHTTVADRRGLFDVHTMDEFQAHALAGTVTITAYSGTDVTDGVDIPGDFQALTTSSATASVPTSSDITLANTANYLLFTQARPTATWNAQAITDNDYVEVLVIGNASKSFDRIYQVLGCTDGVRPKYLHFLRFTGVSVSENIWYVVPTIGETRNILHNHILKLINGTSNTTTVMRLIGCNLAGTAVSIHPMYGCREVFYDGRFPTLYRNNLGAVYEFMWFERGGVGDRVETSANLNNIAHEVNTSSYKRQGFCVFNSTVGKPVWANGNGDGDTWKDAAGTVVNTPV